LEPNRDARLCTQIDENRGLSNPVHIAIIPEENVSLGANSRRTASRHIAKDDDQARVAEWQTRWIQNSLVPMPQLITVFVFASTALTCDPALLVTAGRRTGHLVASAARI
jgi:hypothetical protein